MSCRRLLALALWLLAMLAAPVASAAPAGPAIGDAPPVALLGKDRAGQVVVLGQLRGKVVVVTFWASWCGYCLKELPQLDLLQKHAGDRLLRVVAVNVKDGNDDYRAMMRQMKDYGIAMVRDRNGEIADAWGITAYPNLWIIDPQGRIAAHHRGYAEGALDGIVDEINEALRKAPAGGG